MIPVTAGGRDVGGADLSRSLEDRGVLAERRGGKVELGVDERLHALRLDLGDQRLGGPERRLLEQAHHVE